MSNLFNIFLIIMLNNNRLRTDDIMFLDFVKSLLEIDRHKRLGASEALKHPWLTQAKYPDGIEFE